MPSDLSAFFRTAQELEKASHKLKQCGVIEVRALPPVSNANHQNVSEHKEMEAAAEFIYPLHIFVEKSRINLAEDTIKKCGGKLS